MSVAVISLPASFRSVQSGVSTPGISQYKSYSNLHELELGYSGANRPKSSPVHKLQNRKHGRMHRPKTAAAVLLRNGCDRVNQLQHEATRRHNFESHLPTRKNKQPAWQKKLDPPLVPVMIGPGYVLSRSKSKCSMILKDDFFEPLSDSAPESPTSPDNRKVDKGDPERDALIIALQQQINDLNLYLEEERLNHRQTKIKNEEYLKDRLEDLSQQHKYQIKDLKEENKYNLKNLEKDKQKDFDDYKQITEQQIHKLVTEIEFLQGAFESYKGTLEQEMATKWTLKEEELRQQLETEKNDTFVEFKNKITQEKAGDKANLSKEFQKQRDALRKEHKREIEAMVRRYATAAAELERSKKVNAELEEVQSDLEEIKINYKETCQQLNTTSRQLTDTKVRLLEYEEQFNDKVQTIDDKYREKIDNLMIQNTELRKLYVKKCGQLFEEKSVVERNVLDKVTTAKQTMQELIKVKERSNVNLIASDPDLEKRARKPKNRPASAPTTHPESVSAHLSAGETDHLKKEESFIRPETTLPEDNSEIKRLKEELFSEKVREYTKEDLLNVLAS